MSRRALSFAVVGLLLAGCGSAGAPGNGPASDQAAGSASRTSVADRVFGQGDDATSDGAEDEQDHPSQITLAFAGDVHFERQLAPLLQDLDETWATRLPELKAADFSMVNLETAITERGRRASKTYTFRTSPVALDKLAAAGIDAVGMANNHAADFGDEGIQDTLAAKEKSPIPIVGFGKDEESAYAPLSVDVRGVKVGIVAATEVVEETYRNHSAGPGKPGVAQNVERDRFTQAAKDAVANNDLVVAFLHWGTEGTTCPSERQQETAKVLSEAGVDVIVGTHAHRPQGAGWREDGTFVGYGTGNFVWYNTSTDSRSSGVLTVTVDADAVRDRGDDRGGASVVKSYSWAPKLISSNGVPETPTTSMGRLQRLHEQATACSGLAQQPPAAG